MRCSARRCDADATRRAVVAASGRLAGQRVRVRLQLPVYACAAHGHAGAVWAGLLRTVPRALCATLSNYGVAVPLWPRVRVRFVPLRRHGRAHAPPAPPPLTTCEAGAAI